MNLAQHDLSITTLDANTGVTFRAQVNAALQALATNQSGAGNPDTMYPYQLKVDTSVSPAQIQIRKSDNSEWVRWGYIDATTGKLIVDWDSSLAANNTFTGDNTFTGNNTFQRSANAASSVGGTDNAISATFSPPFASYVDKARVSVRAPSANTSTAPTIAIDGMAAKTISKNNNEPLLVGDIAGGGHDLDLIYNSSFDKFVLLNPRGILPTNMQIFSIGASVASSALTATLAPCNLQFRVPTLSSGAIVTRAVGTQISIVVPENATLGTISGVQSALYVLAIDNAGTVELAIVNVAGGNDLSETGVINTTAISSSSNSADVIYSTTARTNVAYRVVGLVRSTQGTAGTWAAAPTLTQGQGGTALSAMMSVGYGQSWQAVTGSRSIGVTYYNTTGRPILVKIVGTNNSVHFNIILTVNGLALLGPGGAQYTGTECTWLVPASHSYIVSGINVLNYWYELR